MNTTYEAIGTAQALKEAGVEPEQAEAIADAIISHRSELATKADIQALQSDIQNLGKRLEDKINNLRWTMVVVAGVVIALIKLLP